MGMLTVRHKHFGSKPTFSVVSETADILEMRLMSPNIQMAVVMLPVSLEEK